MVVSGNKFHDIRTPGFGNQISIFDWPFHQADVDILPDHLVGDVACVGAGEVEIDAWMSSMECSEIPGAHVCRDRRARA
jgi:hypothetical protein